MVPAVRDPYFQLPEVAAAPLARFGIHHEIASLLSQVQSALVVQGAADASGSFAVRAKMTPLDAEGRPGAPREVQLRLLDQRGLAFEHPAPLAGRRAWMQVESPTLGVISAEIELSWCRYNEGGRYTSGGRFVNVVTPPHGQDDLGIGPRRT